MGTTIAILAAKSDATGWIRWRQLVLPSLLLIACITYGNVILRKEIANPKSSTVAIIQGSLDTEFAESEDDFNRIRKNQEHAFADYSRLTSEVTTQSKVDLVLWPESMFWRYDGILEYDDELANKVMSADGMTLEEIASHLEVATQKHLQLFGVNCLLGTKTHRYHTDGVDQLNTAAFYDADGNLVDVYHKMHPVMFGEYIPFGDVFPWLYDFAPIPGALTAGEHPRAFTAGDVSFAPLICFENTVPQLVRRNLLELEQSGAPATALVTLTNDGWFWGSALLDVHLACGIFRAIENRRPMLIAANTGISAHIDQCGRVLQSTPKRASRVIVADVVGSEEASLYTRYGDRFGLVCLALSAIGLIVGFAART